MVAALVAWGARPAMADHESVGIVVWAGEGEVLLLTDDHLHIVEVTADTALVDEAGDPIRRLAVGDRVRERCAPTPDGGFAASRIEVLRPARHRAEPAEV